MFPKMKRGGLFCFTLWAQRDADIMSPETGPGITHNQFLNNNTHILGHINQTPGGQSSIGKLLVAISYNDFLFPANYAINNQSTNQDIDARDNYWDHSTGPYNLTNNPAGQGVPVSLRVSFNPWTITPYNAVPTFSIHGRVTTGNLGDPQPGIAGVNLTLLPGNYSTTTDQDGYYSYDGLEYDEYTVIPSLAGWLFAPSQQRIELIGDAKIDFVGTLGTSNFIMSIDNAWVLKPASGNSQAIFKIRLSKAATFPVVVQYRTEPGTAQPGMDYVAVSGQQVTFNPGDVEKTITITIMSGPYTEGDKYFLVYLQNPSPAASVYLLAGAEYGMGTILVPTDFLFLPVVRR